MALSSLVAVSQHPDKQVLMDIRKTIEKSSPMVSSDGLLSLTEALSDCLSALSSIKITAELIKDLKLGNIVASLNHKLETVSADKSAKEDVCAAAEGFGNSCKAILLSWKRIIESSKQQQKARSSTTNKDIKSPVIVTTAPAVAGDETVPTNKELNNSSGGSSSGGGGSSSGSSSGGGGGSSGRGISSGGGSGGGGGSSGGGSVSSGNGGSGSSDTIAGTISSITNTSATGNSSTSVSDSTMSLSRRQVLLILSNTLKGKQPTIPAAKINDRAGKVELQIHSKFPNEKDYVAKAKSLSFNLKKNEALRQSVLNGSVSAESLVSMSSTQLATHELLEKREKISEANAESRRTDWLEENKRSIQTTIGIDPNNAWVYDDDDDKMSEPDTDPPDI